MYAIYSLVSIAILIYLALGPYNTYRVDRLRNQLFELRDKLFDDARAGRISFDSPAYGATRTFMNGMIRYAHQTSLSSFVAFGFVMRGRHESVAKIAIHQRFEEATEADLAHCKPYFNQANMLLIQHLMSSPFMLVLIAPVWTFVLARVGVDLAATLVSRMRHQLIGIDEAALLTGAETRT